MILESDARAVGKALTGNLQNAEEFDDWSTVSTVRTFVKLAKYFCSFNFCYKLRELNSRAHL